MSDQPRTPDGRFHFKGAYAQQQRRVERGGMNAFIRGGTVARPDPAADPDPNAEPVPVTGAGFDGGTHGTGDAPAETGSQKVSNAIRRGFEN
jgi:hypothetical protein